MFHLHHSGKLAIILVATAGGIVGLLKLDYATSPSGGSDRTISHVTDDKSAEDRASAELQAERPKSPADTAQFSTPDSASASDELVSRSADYKTAKAAEAERNHAAMLERAKKLVQAYPGSSIAYKCLADALYYTGAFNDALTAANKAIAINAKDSVAWNDLGTIYVAMKRLKDAESAYKQALKLDDEPKPRANLGALYFQQGRKAEAAVETDKAARSLKAKPFNTHHGELREVWVWIEIAENYLDLKHPLDAEKVLKRAVEIEPVEARAWHYLGLAYGDQKKTSEAIAAFKKAVEIKPDYWLSLSSLGDIYLTAKKPSEAVAVLEQAARIKPDEDMVWESLGEAYRDLGRKTDAIAANRKVIEIQPRNANAWRDHALAHLDGFTAAKLDAKDTSEAEASIKKAIEIKPDYAEAWDTLGFVYEMQGRLPEAIEAYRKMVKLKPAKAAGWSYLGRALIKQGALEEAAGSFRKRVALTPNDATSWFWLGLAYEQQRKTAESATAYARANKIVPGIVAATKAAQSAARDAEDGEKARQEFEAWRKVNGPRLAEMDRQSQRGPYVGRTPADDKAQEEAAARINTRFYAAQDAAARRLQAKADADARNQEYLEEVRAEAEEKRRALAREWAQDRAQQRAQVDADWAEMQANQRARQNENRLQEIERQQQRIEQQQRWQQQQQNLRR